MCCSIPKCGCLEVDCDPVVELPGRLRFRVRCASFSLPIARNELMILETRTQMYEVLTCVSVRVQKDRIDIRLEIRMLIIRLELE